MTETEPVGATMEKLSGYATLALTVASRMVEVLAHRRRQQLDTARRQSEQAARQLQDQQRAEVAATRLQLRGVGGKEWWDKASPEEVAMAYATARAYGQIDPELHGTARYMAEEIGKRYGVDADTLVDRETRRTRSDLAAWNDYEKGEAPRPAGEHPDPQRAQEIAARDAAAKAQASADWAAAIGLTAEADVVDAVVRAEMDELNQVNNTEPALAMQAEGAPTRAELDEEARDARLVAEGKLPADGTRPVEQAKAGWDDPARHETLAARLDAALPDQPEAVSARLTVDAAQGKPATAATTARQTGKAPAARPPRVKGAERVTGR